MLTERTTTLFVSIFISKVSNSGLYHEWMGLTTTCHFLIMV